MRQSAAGRVDFPSSVPAAPQAVVRTLLLTDLVDSTRIVEQLGDVGAFHLATRHDRIARDLLAQHGGLEIDKTDGFFFLFARPQDAVAYALDYHRALTRLSIEVGVQIRARTGIHQGEVLLRENPPADVARGAKAIDVDGLAKPMAARLMSLAAGKQVLMTESAFNQARQESFGDGSDLIWLAHGPYLFKGVAEPVEVFEVGAQGVSKLAVPADTEKARRAVAAGDEATLGWRPGPGLEIPRRPGWKIEKKLGTGGFGEIWLARQRETGEPRAFKFCYEAAPLRALQREVTLFRLLKETLGDRDEIVRILGWSFDEAPYFLEIEYVDGGSLVEWAEARGGIGAVPLTERLEIAAQVADALAAAHSVGVLHKDVKPQNVLVTRDGQGGARAKLADFGIAQVLDQRALLVKDITILGLTELATPSSGGSHLYMAPEIAEGKPATVQADLYGLGVLLYQMIAGDFRHALAPGWQRDIEDELLAEDLACFVDGSPARRPASAREVADRLRRLEERRAARDAELRAQAQAEAQRRALEQAHRRRKQLTAIATAAVVVLVVVAAFAIQAERAERISEQRRGQAEDLIGFMVGDLRDKLAPVGKLEILDSVGAKAMEYFAAVPEDELSDQELLSRSKVLSQIGSIRIDQGKMAEALPPLQESLTLATALSRRAPEDAQRKFELGQSLFWVGYAEWLQGNLAAALAHFRQYLAVSQELVKRDPTNRDWQLEVAYGHSNIGAVLEAKDDLTGALREYQATLAIKKNLALREPTNADLRLVVARTHNSIAVLKQRLGDFTGALRDFQTELALKQALVQEQPNQTQWRRELAIAHNYMGAALEDLGEDERAFVHYEQAVSLLQTLVASDPGNQRWQCDLANNQLRVGRLFRNQGDLHAARTQVESCVDRMKVLVASDPKNRKWSRSLADCRNQLSKLLLLSGNLALAERESVSARKIGADLIAKGDRTALEVVSISDLVLGKIRAQAGDMKQARDSWMLAVSSLSPIAEQSRDRRLLDPLVQGLIYLDRLEEAKPLVLWLIQRGYKRREFVEACRRAGLGSLLAKEAIPTHHSN